MNVMCDMNQFVKVFPALDDISDTLANYCIQHVLIKFGRYHLVVLDDGTPFKGDFIAMCPAFKLNCDIIAKGNYKGLTVKNFQRFLNINITIAAGECDTNNILVPTDITADYTRNSSPIDDTDIPLSISVIDQKLHLPIEIYINSIAKMIKINVHASLEYLMLTDFSGQFSFSILTIIFDGRQSAHVELINNDKNFIVLQGSDIVLI